MWFQKILILSSGPFRKLFNQLKISPFFSLLLDFCQDQSEWIKDYLKFLLFIMVNSWHRSMTSCGQCTTNLFLMILNCTCIVHNNVVKFMFSKKATKIYKIFTVDLSLCSNYQIDSGPRMKISSIFMAFLENTNFKKDLEIR